MTKFRTLAFAAAFALTGFVQADAQTANGVVSTNAPTYTDGTPAPLSLDTDGNLRVTGGGGGGGGDVNITAVGGNAVTTTVPVSGTVSTGGLTDAELRATPVGVIAAGDVAANAVDSGNPVKIGGVYNFTSAQVGDGDRADLQTSQYGALWTFNSAQFAGHDNASNTMAYSIPRNLPGGTGVLSAIGMHVFDGTAWDRLRGDSTDGVMVNLGGNNDVEAIPTTSGGGTSNHSAIMANTTNATSVKASAGTLYELSVYNNSADIAYLKIYNTASAPTCGSGTPVARYLIPGASAGGAGSNVNISLGKSFATGIGYCVTGAIGDSDTTAVAADAYIVNITYK